MNGIIIKSWDRKISTGIISKNTHQEIYGVNSFRHRQRRETLRMQWKDYLS